MSQPLLSGLCFKGKGIQLPKQKQSKSVSLSLAISLLDKEAFDRAISRTGVSESEFATYWVRHGIEHSDPQATYFDDDLVRAVEEMVIEIRAEQPATTQPPTATTVELASVIETTRTGFNAMKPDTRYLLIKYLEAAAMVTVQPKFQQTAKGGAR